MAIIAAGLMAVAAILYLTRGPSTMPGESPAEDATVTSAAPQRSSTAPSTKTNTPSQAGDAAEAERVAVTALTAMWSWTPNADSSRADAVDRAIPWFTAELAKSSTTGGSLERGQGLEWEQWKDEGARVDAAVTVGCSGCPPDTADRIDRVATVKQTVVHADGSTEAGDTLTIWVAMTKEHAGWRVAEWTI